MNNNELEMNQHTIFYQTLNMYKKYEKTSNVDIYRVFEGMHKVIQIMRWSGLFEEYANSEGVEIKWL